MLTVVILLPIAVALAAGVAESRLGLARPVPAQPGQQRGISFLAESLAYVGTLLVLAGSAIVTQQRWLSLTSTERIMAVTGAALTLLLAGFVVRWVALSDSRRLTESVWLASAVLAAAATAMTGRGYHASVLVLAVSGQQAAYSFALWLHCRRELLAVAAFAGLIGALCSLIAIAAGGQAPWLAVALGIWLLGIAWTVLGVGYPQPLGTSVAAGAAVTLLAPAIAVHQYPWVYGIGILTAAVVMGASVPLQNIVMLVFGSCALFCYLAATVFRLADHALGLAQTLIVVGGFLICVAVATVWLAKLVRGATRHSGRAQARTA